MLSCRNVCASCRTDEITIYTWYIEFIRAQQIFWSSKLKIGRGNKPDLLLSWFVEVISIRTINFDVVKQLKCLVVTSISWKVTNVRGRSCTTCLECDKCSSTRFHASHTTNVTKWASIYLCILLILTFDIFTMRQAWRSLESEASRETYPLCESGYEYHVITQCAVSENTTKSRHAHTSRKADLWQRQPCSALRLNWWVLLNLACFALRRFV